MRTATPDGIGPKPNRRSSPAVIAAVALLLLLGVLAAAILLSQSSARSQLRASFALRGKASAGFATTYLSEQAVRERRAGERFLSAPRVRERAAQVIASTLGGDSAVLLDERGHVLGAYAPSASLRETAVLAAFSNLPRVASAGMAISDLFYSSVVAPPSTAVTVSFATGHGRRMLSVDYATTNLALDGLVDQVISYPQHDVYLVDRAAQIVTSSPRTLAPTLAGANPALARALAHAPSGSVESAHAQSTFTSSAVAGTPWRLVIEVPNWRLYKSIAGWTQYVPWLVLVLVAALGSLLVLLFGRSLADRARLTALSAQMRRTAQTDSLTGLDNRRALTETLARAGAHARRHEQPLSVMMIDLDRFKQTNDAFGHEAGDEVLCTVADCMREVLRGEDVYGRWGGDEFLVALPSTDRAGAEATAQRLREAAAAAPLAQIGLPDGVPLSIGVATGIHESPIELVRAADEELYRAKADGRRAATKAEGRAATSRREPSFSAR